VFHGYVPCIAAHKLGYSVDTPRLPATGFRFYTVYTSICCDYKAGELRDGTRALEIEDVFERQLGRGRIQRLVGEMDALAVIIGKQRLPLVAVPLTAKTLAGLGIEDIPRG